MRNENVNDETYMLIKQNYAFRCLELIKMVRVWNDLAFGWDDTYTVIDTGDSSAHELAEKHNLTIKHYDGSKFVCN